MKTDVPFTLYADRRARVASKLGKDDIAIVPTAPERPRNRDSDFQFRHDSYFYYLTGFTEPHAWLVITGDGKSHLFCQPKDLEREIWDGYRLGPDAAPSALGVDAPQSVNELDAAMPKLLENKHAVWYPFGIHAGLEARVAGWLAPVRARVRYGALCPEEQHDLCAVLDEMRLVKDVLVLAFLRRAGEISARAHVRTMKACAQWLREGKDVREYHLDAELMHEFRMGGSQYPAYASIVAAGANACVLHYRADAAPVRGGELVLIDAGCELDGYASDITRTFPADGVFSGPQKTLYEIVLAAQAAAIAELRPGKRFTDGHEANVRVLAQGMRDTGLLDKNKVGPLDEVIGKGDYRQFYMHRTGHWIGMDVHDVGDYRDPPATSEERPWRTLQPGMALTGEPGIYVRPAEGVLDQYWIIGIRFEVVALVTPDGCDILSSDAPKTKTKKEAVMKH